MKKIIKYLGIFLSVVLMGAFTSCRVEEPEGPAALGLNLKVFFPTKVVTGQPMTINGSGLADTKEIVFPGDVVVTNFELVSNEMIRLTAPAGIASGGGKIIVRTSNEEAESRLSLTLGNTVVSGYSKQAGESAEGGELITIYGKDVEFINGVELLDSEGNPNLVKDADFYRKGTNSVIFYVPRKNIFEGTFAGKVHTYDGQTFTMPELAYKPAQDGGHWEIQKNILWENDGTPIPAWGGTFRFGLDGNDGNNECIATFPADVWALIKDGTVRVAVDVNESSNIRITTGWWSGAYGGTDHNCVDFIQEEEDGTKYIELNIKEEGTLYDLIDQQHLLFTGDNYTVLEIYVNEWVEGGGAAKEIVLWEGEAIADDWGNQPNLLSDAGIELQEAGAKAGQEVRFYVTATDSEWHLKIIEGHWGDTYLSYCSVGCDTNGGEFVEYDLEANGGYMALTLTQEILDAAFTQQWWGGTFLGNGDNVKITKITLF